MYQYVSQNGHIDEAMPDIDPTAAQVPKEG